MASLWTNRGKLELAQFDVRAIVLRAMLVDADGDTVATVDLNTVAEIVVDELAGAGRKTLVNVTTTEDDAADRAVLDADDLVWAAANFGTIGGAWIYRRVGGADANTDPLWCYIDVEPELPTNGGDVTLAFPNGWGRIA